MNNEEITQQGTDLNISLIGDRVLIQLNQIPDHTKTKAGLWIPANELAETDGGKVTTRPSKQKYYAEGTIIALGNTAFSRLNAEVSVKEGDKVLVAKQAMSSDSFHFYTDRSTQIQDFKGLICIPHTLIEAKL